MTRAWSRIGHAAYGPIVLATIVAAGMSLSTRLLAAPYTPASDSVVVERLPQRSGKASTARLALRERWRREPNNATVASDLAREYFELAMAEGDPRYVGYAQAALTPWWTQPRPPLDVQVVRGMLLQYNHQFERGLADLQAVADASPQDPLAWAWLAAVHMVRADYFEARKACERLMPLTVELAAAGCMAYVESMTGQAAAGAARLMAALKKQAKAEPSLTLWALTRLAEIQERRGLPMKAQEAYEQALALGITDTYLYAAYADFLLDQGQPERVIRMLQSRKQADALLLRLALAAHRTQSSQAPAWIQELGTRFEAARAQGDARHEKEESRFALALLGDCRRALSLATSNFRSQREAADARALMEAALACRDRAAAEPALNWMQTHGVESVVLQGLAKQLRALP